MEEVDNHEDSTVLLLQEQQELVAPLTSTAVAAAATRTTEPNQPLLRWPPLQPGPDWTLLSQGAEARIWKIPLNDNQQQSQQEKKNEEISLHVNDVDNSNDDPMNVDVDANSSNNNNNKQHPPESKRQRYSTGDQLVVEVEPKFQIVKERFSKRYRHVRLDDKLTQQRCRAEARLLEKCRHAIGSHIKNTTNTTVGKSCVPSLQVPRVLRVQAPLLYLEFIHGMTVRHYLEDYLLLQLQQQQPANVVPPPYAEQPDLIPRTENQEEHELFLAEQALLQTQASDAATTTATTNDAKKNTNLLPSEDLTILAQSMGRMLGFLHGTLGIIHGDLTTSNMMLPFSENWNPTTTTTATTTTKLTSTTTTASSSSLLSQQQQQQQQLPPITLIDFGLAKQQQNSASAEERAVDLYVLERALASTHPALPLTAFLQVLYQAYAVTADAAHDKDENNNNNNNKGGNSKKKQATSKDTLNRLEQVRLRGRKRECFG